MAYDRLPLELLQYILSYLTYDDVKKASLVCRHWQDACEKCIVGNGCIHISEEAVDNLDVIRNLTRNYRSIRISAMQDWNTLELAMAECIERFPEIYELFFDGFSVYGIHRICVTYCNWMEHCVSLRVAPYLLIYSGEQQTFVVHLPALKHLVWKEQEYSARTSQKTLTIKAPTLETVDLDFNAWSNQPVSIENCDRIKHIRFMHCRQLIRMTKCSFDHVETLELSIDINFFDFSILKKMPRLRSLQITDLCGLEFAGSWNLQFTDLCEQNLAENIICCTYLRDLKIIGKHHGRSILDPQDLFANESALETLALRFITVSSNRTIQAEHLLKLTLDGMEFPEETIILHAPKLQQLSVELEALEILELSCSSSLTELRVRLGATGVERSLEQIIGAFTHRHCNVKVLTLIGSTNYKEIKLDPYEIDSDRVVLDVEYLELRQIRVNVDFFRTVAKWTPLQRLHLNDCWIDCGDLADNERIQLPNVQVMLLEDVSLKNTDRSDLPVVVGNDTVVRIGTGQRVSRIKLH